MVKISMCSIKDSGSPALNDMPATIGTTPPSPAEHTGNFSPALLGDPARSDGRLVVPVLFLVFNRPDHTSRVFEAIRRAQPRRLYIAADGPRPSRPDEARRCEEVRTIVAQIDWPCEVKTLLRSENLGCKRAVSGAITWFFENEPEGIILEDDCLPSSSFFWFCQELLARFRDDERIWQVCGTAMLKLSSHSSLEDSYIFSRYGSIWGWAGWRRAWAHYDPNMTDWLRMRRPQVLNSVFKTRPERNRLLDLGNKLHRGQLDTWDYQWDFTKAYQSGLSVIPSVNLILNIGFGAEATHTLKPERWTPSANMDIQMPLTHPQYVVVNETHDLLYRRKVLLGSHRERGKRAIKKLLRLGYSLCVESLRTLKWSAFCVRERRS